MCYFQGNVEVPLSVSLYNCGSICETLFMQRALRPSCSYAVSKLVDLIDFETKTYSTRCAKHAGAPIIAADMSKLLFMPTRLMRKPVSGPT